MLASPDERIRNRFVGCYPLFLVEGGADAPPAEHPKSRRQGRSEAEFQRPAVRAAKPPRTSRTCEPALAPLGDGAPPSSARLASRPLAPLASGLPGKPPPHRGRSTKGQQDARTKGRAPPAEGTRGRAIKSPRAPKASGARPVVLSSFRPVVERAGLRGLRRRRAEVS